MRREQLETIYRLGGEQAFARAVHSRGWVTTACPLCGPPDSVSRALVRLRDRESDGHLLAAWELDLVYSQAALRQFDCNLCAGYRRVRVLKAGQWYGAPLDERYLRIVPNRP